MNTVFDVYKGYALVAVCDATALARWFPQGIPDRSAGVKPWCFCGVWGCGGTWWCERRFV